MIKLLHADAGPRALAVCRIVIFGLCLHRLWNADVLRLAQLPPDWHHQRGIMRWLPEEALLYLLQPEVLGCLYAAAIALGVCAVLGLRFYHAAATGFCLLFFLFQAIGHGFSGFVGHSNMALMFSSWILAAFPAADAIAAQQKSRTKDPVFYAAPLVFMSAAICLAYSLLGLRRFMHGGLEIFTGDTILTFFAVRSLMHSAHGYEYGLVFLSHPALIVAAKAGFLLITLFELLAPVCMVSKRFRLVWVGLMIPFHISTLFTMNIFFRANLILIILLLLPACRWLDDGSKPVERCRKWIAIFRGRCPGIIGAAPPHPLKSGDSADLR